MKRWIVCLIFLSVLFVGTVFAQPQIQTENGWRFSVISADGKCQIEGYEGTCPSHLVIPETLGGYQVHSIAQRAFANRSEIVSVTFPSTLIYTNGYVFENCSSLKELIFHPEANTRFGYGDFGNCDALEEVEFPYGTKKIGDYVFIGCDNLGRVSLPETIRENVYECFKECPNLEWKTYDGVDYLGNPENPYCIAVHVNNTQLTQVTLHKDCKVLNYRLFAYCEKLERAVLPEGLLTIQGYAFESCSSLTQLNIPSGVRWLGFDPFFQTKVSADWKFSDELKNIGQMTYLPDDIQDYYTYNSYKNGWYLGIEGNPYYALVGGMANSDGSFEIHKDTKIIADNALTETNVRSLLIPEGLEVVGDFALSGCPLENFKFPASIKCVGAGMEEYLTDQPERHSLGWFESGDGHYYGCLCGDHYQRPVAHSSPQGANCVKKGSCKDCGATAGSPDANRHGKIQTVNAQEASCVKTGYTGDQICRDCQKVLHTGSILPLTSHRDADDRWNADESGHFYRCLCGMSFAKEAHHFGEFSPVDSRQTQRRTCKICSYQEKRQLPSSESAAPLQSPSSAVAASSVCASSLPSSVATSSVCASSLPSSSLPPVESSLPSSVATSTHSPEEQGGFPWWSLVVLLVVGGAAGTGIYLVKVKGIRLW